MAHTRTIAVVSFVAASLLLAAHGTRAEDFSGKPIKFLVGASPGGTTDTMARGSLRCQPPAPFRKPFKPIAEDGFMSVNDCQQI